MATILAIESSCDETSASLVEDGKVLNNVIATQSIHQLYGGVVPELASREHMKQIVPVVRAALDQTKIKLSNIDAIAYTKGPGLLGSLLVSASFAKSLSISLNIPLIGVNHMKAHILAHYIDDPIPKQQFLCLTVSGGHTQLVLVHHPAKMEVIGETRDDAVGEAFDKCAKMMGLDYPGGPLIDKYAQGGDASRFSFPHSELPDLEYSFSGIKTAFLYFLRDNKKVDPDFVEKNRADICASIQDHLINMLLSKFKKAVRERKITDIAVAGGVSANSALRLALKDWAKEDHLNLFVPDFQYCTDNAGMIAMAAHFMYEEGVFQDLDEVPSARLPFKSDFA